MAQGATAVGTVETMKVRKFVRMLDRLLNETRKTQREIAMELGYDKPNIITMFKQGTTRVPVDRIPALARALDVDPVDMMRLWLEEYEPIMAETLANTFGVTLSKNEKSWLQKLRKIYPDGVPAWSREVELSLANIK